MGILSELVRSKEWLTIAEAARCLGRAFEENVFEADVFQFALTRRLTISARFPAPVAAIKLPETTSLRIARGDQEFELAKEPGIKLVDLEGVFDLPMVGLERYGVENAYRKLIDEPRVELDEAFPTSHGPFVESSNTGALFGLQILPQSLESEPDFSWNHLPSDTLFVVRPDALEEFASRMRTTAESITATPPDAGARPQRRPHLANAPMHPRAPHRTGKTMAFSILRIMTSIRNKVEEPQSAHSWTWSTGTRRTVSSRNTSGRLQSIRTRGSFSTGSKWHRKGQRLVTRPSAAFSACQHQTSSNR